MTQPEAVIKTLEQLGGFATLENIYRKVFEIKECKWGAVNPYASIRSIVQTKKGIYKIKPGLYGLEKYKTQNENNGAIVETEKNKDSEERNKFNHTYYQGILLIYGSYRGMKTYIPNQDKNQKFYDGRTLRELSTLSKQPEYSYCSFLKCSATIDTIWFNERNMPHSFFEVEHSTNIQHSLVKFNDLQDFNVKMYIVADEKRKSEFHKKLASCAFDRIRERVEFLSYDELIYQYEKEVEKQSLNCIL